VVVHIAGCRENGHQTRKQTAVAVVFLAGGMTPCLQSKELTTKQPTNHQATRYARSPGAAVPGPSDSTLSTDAVAPRAAAAAAADDDDADDSEDASDEREGK